jgi:predicted ATPase
VTIEGFKAIRRASIPLEPFTLFIGRNGAGKSSVLEALQWLQGALIRGLGEATAVPYQSFRDVRNRRCSSVYLDLRFEKTARFPTHYEVRVRAGAGLAPRPIVDFERCVVGRTNAARTVVWSRADTREKRGPPFRWVRSRTSERALVLRDGDALGLALTKARIPGAGDLAGFLEGSVFLRLSPTALASEVRPRGRSRGPVLAEDGSDLPLLIERLTKSARRALVKRLAAIFPSVQDVGVAKSGVAKHLVVAERMIARGGTRTFGIPSWLLSEGMRRLVAIFTLLEVQPRPPLIAIEEIENGLDPWTLEHVLDALRTASAEGTQIIVTTHSPFLLDHVDLREVVHVRRDSGESTYEPVVSLPEVAKYQDVLAPGAMYLSKLFGAERKASDASEE